MAWGVGSIIHCEEEEKGSSYLFDEGKVNRPGSSIAECPPVAELNSH